jgi:hypothetical protein
MPPANACTWAVVEAKVFQMNQQKLLLLKAPQSSFCLKGREPNQSYTET